MRVSRLASIVGSAVLVAAATAQADTPPAPDWRGQLVKLYTLSVAIDTCGEIGISSGDEDRLDRAISAAEAKLALTEEASGALYDQLSATADNDREAFCKEVAPKVKPGIDKLPE